MKALAGKEYSDAHDGSFWMQLDDFIIQFNKLYVCKIFPDSTWFKKIIRVNIFLYLLGIF